MNQRLFFTLEHELNGKLYRLAIEIGTPWTEAIQAAKDMAVRIEELSELAKQAATQPPQSETQEPSTTPEAPSEYH